MNANELADELDGFLKEQEQLPWGTKQVYLDQAATMLRQQQAEIKALKKTCADIHENGAQVIDNLDKIILRQMKQIEMLQRNQNGCD